MPSIFQQAIQRTRDELPGTFAVCAERLDTGKSAHAGARLAWNEDAVFPAASAIKIAVALVAMDALDPKELLEVREADKVIGSGVLAAMDPGRFSVGDLLYLATAISDNTAANVLTDRVGLAAINARLASLGLTTTRLTGKLISEQGEFSPTTAAELVTLMRHVHGHVRLMALLERTQTASTIGRGLPDERFPGVGPTPPTIRLAYKTGSIVGVVAEAGIVTTPTATYAVALLSKDSGDLRPNHTNVARVQLGDLSRSIHATLTETEI